MPRSAAAFLFFVLALAGCQPGVPAPPPLPDSLRAELVTKTSDTPPSEGKSICWADDTMPAIIETVTEQVLVRPEQRNPEGELISAAVFRTETAQRIVQDRREVWFRTPCPELLTLDLTASLQRALKARGFYRGDLTGQFDAQTRRAIRQYQEPLGLDSERLSLAAARRLGVVAGEFAF
ncbi:peptidoglycan-binding protein [Pseudorhodobacter sp. E13]|uniref:peptidoglycan-binding domain-containing protein n=1 Tax=Pseudorhodobacter sp. E13 TaxID=2487931 RepID=UPI000F8DFFEF|nr:peptidoglycan-binding domain-containing protein [Pseudorhodobacter sp. E13]RUS63262.1 peptidoglycan-binding protein [Pseudorhodobacter sp. E13]